VGGEGWGSPPGVGLAAGRPRIDSTRLRTTSSIELSRKPFSVTTRDTSPWSTSTIATAGTDLCWYGPSRYPRLNAEQSPRKPAIVAATLRNGPPKLRASRNTCAMVSRFVDIIDASKRLKVPEKNPFSSGSQSASWRERLAHGSL
jgi:hypothetical protein